jgi:DNA-binding IclR family transcriptional regulator
MSVLRALGRAGGHATLSDLSAAVHLPPSKTHRYLKALCAGGFVEQEAVTGRYLLGAESLCLGLAALANIDIVALASALIAALSTRLNQTILLSVWANQGATVVLVEEPRRRVTVVTRLGSVLPLLSSASGLVFAAYLPEEETKAQRRREMRQHWRGAGQGDVELLRRVGTIRETGLAAVHSLFFPGIDAVAAAIFDASGRIAAVMTVLGPTTSFDAALDGATARQVEAAAAALSARLGYQGTWPAPDPDAASKPERTRSKSSAVSTPPGGAAVKATK